MVCFRWISQRLLPPGFDLRIRGWRLCGEGDADADCVRLIDAWLIDPFDLRPPARKHRSLALGIAESRERARWLMRGYGDALSWDTSLDELAVRAERLLLPTWPAIRHHGRLELDPGARDASVHGQRLRLHPREFLLLWRLSDEPGVAIPRTELLRDVLGLTIEPQTNTLAVHVCRLRKKLHTARLSHLLVTGPGNGSYALLVDSDQRPLFDWRNPLDDGDDSGEETVLIEEAAE